MYPDRVGRVLLDGVVDPRDYIAALDLSQINLVDAATNTFEHCHAAGFKNCPFYTGNTAKDIAKRFENLFVPLNSTYADISSHVRELESQRFSCRRDVGYYPGHVHRLAY